MSLARYQIVGKQAALLASLTQGLIAYLEKPVFRQKKQAYTTD